MEDMYKDALRKLRTQSKPLFNGFSVDWDYRSFQRPESNTLPELESATAEDPEKYYESEEAPKVTEKKQVLESFTQFTKEKLEVDPVLTFKGGQVTQANQLDHEGTSVKGVTKFLELQSAHFSKEFIDFRFGQKDLESGQARKVLFVSDAFIESPDMVENSSLKELVCFFDEGVAGLFERMITAMGLGPDDYVVSALHPQKDEEQVLRENLISEILYFKPNYIVTLGAKAVNELLGTHKRLKNIHGQFFDLKFTDQDGKILESKLMPLFSPKLLHIAPNMKQTAWKDMQKLMEKL